MSRQGLWGGMNVADRYALTGDIGGGGLGRVHSAIPFSDPSQTVAIRIIKRKRLLSSDILHFQNLANALRRLRHPNILSFHELGLYQPQKSDGSMLAKGFMVVGELPRGKNLRDWLLKDDLQRLDLCFDLTLQISGALDYAHSKGIVHCGLQPISILIDDSTGDYKRLYRIRDLGLKALAQGIAEPLSPDGGNVATYQAPECSGLIDAPIDHRADLYSLGCILYEILSGRPPFANEDASKLARNHAYLAPDSLRVLNPEVPDWLFELILRLMAKNPSDRYQSAFGLHCDLQKVLRLSQEKKPIRSSEFGLYDKLPLQSTQLPLLGREDELKRLITSLRMDNDPERLSDSNTRVMLIRGGRGSGKTRLMQEFRSYLSRQRIPVISCRFQRTENRLPFNALTSGLNDYLSQVHRSESSEIEAIKLRVATQLGASAPLAASIVPGLKLYLEGDGDESLDADMNLAASYEAEDFNKVFGDFSRCLAAEDEPVAFLFDDMHYADKKTLNLIYHFLSKSPSYRFILIASFRTNCQSSQIRFQEFINRFSHLDRRWQTIDVDPLREAQVQQLSQHLMPLNEGQRDDLHRYLYNKTRGNPLRLSESIRHLLVHDVLHFGQDGRWLFHADRASKIELEKASTEMCIRDRGFLYGRPDDAMFDQAFEGTYEDGSYMTCGPEALMQQTVEYLRLKGVPEEHIHLESFGN